MKQQDSLPQPTAKDASALRSALLKLTAPHKLVSATVITVTVLIWYVLLQRLVRFGKAIDYDGLHWLGAHTVTLFKQYNPFFWWAVVALVSLIIAWLLYGFVQTQQQRSRKALVSQLVIADLAQQLSEPAKEVMRWVWHDTRFPITVGDLQRSLSELRSGRSQKIDLARQHAALIATVTTNTQQQTEPTSRLRAS